MDLDGPSCDQSHLYAIWPGVSMILTSSVYQEPMGPQAPKSAGKPNRTFVSFPRRMLMMITVCDLHENAAKPSPQIQRKCTYGPQANCSREMICQSLSILGQWRQRFGIDCPVERITTRSNVEYWKSECGNTRESTGGLAEISCIPSDWSYPTYTLYRM